MGRVISHEVKMFLGLIPVLSGLEFRAIERLGILILTSMAAFSRLLILESRSLETNMSTLGSRVGKKRQFMAKIWLMSPEAGLFLTWQMSRLGLLHARSHSSLISGSSGSRS